MDDFRGKRVTVAGLGRFGGGIVVSQWLVQQGARVLVTDQSPEEKLRESKEKLGGLPIEFRLGEHREEDFTSADLVVTSPALPPSNKYLQAARAAGVPVTTEIMLFIERCPARIVGISGTKGKSTTTAMIGQLLAGRFRTWVGGNIGKSLLLDLPNIGKDDLVVLELSSFMLDYLATRSWSPHVAVLTMVAADHIEWHGSVAAYAEAKKTLVRFQTPNDFAILNEENELTGELIHQTRAKVILFGLKNRRPFELIIPGRHNQLNAQAAFAAAGVFGVSWEQAQAVLAKFAGLPHRLQLVHEENGVRYYNDSIATIPEAAVAALDSFPGRKVIQIVGGYDKHLPFTDMCAALAERAKAVLCIGATGSKIAGLMGESPKIGGAAAYECGDLKTAVETAKKIAAPGDVVLLSTGCASYDQFVNFEQRGEMFSRLARGEV